MNIALIGSGGREHALCKKLLESDKVNKVFCMPGNAGTSKISINITINISDFNLILKTVKILKIDLVVVGPEQPLVDGIVDFLQKHKIKVFGPNKYASKLEGSKAFMKSMCRKYNIPTANFKICGKKTDVLEFLKTSFMPVVVKADGLASGKGVSICNKKSDVIKISNEIFKGKYKSSNKLILEEFLVGEEASYFLVVDKKNFSFIGSAQDHKKVGERDTGKNTGGMGAYSPAPIITGEIEKKIKKKIIIPTLKALKDNKKPYTGFLYAGLMIKDNEPYLIEYNIRMGDPECQVIMPRLKTSLIDIINFSIKNKLNRLKIEWFKKKSMTIVICAKGYPGKYVKNKIIKNINNIKIGKNEIIYHAGTKLNKNNVVSDGGRVLNVTCTGKNFFKIRNNIFKLIKKINWKHGFFRKDIGWKVI